MNDYIIHTPHDIEIYTPILMPLDDASLILIMPFGLSCIMNATSNRQAAAQGFGRPEVTRLDLAQMTSEFGEA